MDLDIGGDGLFTTLGEEDGLWINNVSYRNANEGP